MCEKYRALTIRLAILKKYREQSPPASKNKRVEEVSESHISKSRCGAPEFLERVICGGAAAKSLCAFKKNSTKQLFFENGVRVGVRKMAE